MKKLFKNSLFTFILGAIIFSSITAFATITYTASQVRYTKSNNQEVTLDSALDELYSSASLEEFIPAESYDPSGTSKTLYTSGKRIKGNIVINAIPSSYKLVGSSTVSQASDILEGKTAYLSNGDLVTGTRKECVHGSFICNSSCANSTYTFLNFKPSFFIITLYNNNVHAGHMYFSNGGFMKFTKTSEGTTGSGNIEYVGTTYKYYTINQNNVTMNEMGSGWLNKTVYYTACK